MTSNVAASQPPSDGEHVKAPPLFAIWLIPLVAGFGGIVGVGIRLASRGADFVDAAEVGIPAGFEFQKLSDGVESPSVGGKIILGRWYLPQIGRTASAVLGRVNEFPPDAQLPKYLEQQIRETHEQAREDEDFRVRDSHLASIADRAIAVFEVDDGAVHVRTAALRAGDVQLVLFVGASRFEPDEPNRIAFDSLVQSLARLRPKHAPQSAARLLGGFWRGLVIASLPSLILSFVVSLRRRAAWDRRVLSSGSGDERSK